MPPHDRDRPASLGAILAGGASRRFGSPKALAAVGGRPIVERVRDAVGSVVDDVVLVANAPELFAGLGLPVRPDGVPGVGALGGVRTALIWAREEGRPGALCVACDMPFVSPALLMRLLERAAASGAGAVVPESRGRRGVEPLCAWYSAACVEVVDRMIEEGDTAVHALLARVRVDRVPLDEVERIGDAGVLFLNVNTAEDHERAMRIAAGGG